LYVYIFLGHPICNGIPGDRWNTCCHVDFIWSVIKTVFILTHFYNINFSWIFSCEYKKLGNACIVKNFWCILQNLAFDLCEWCQLCQSCVGQWSLCERCIWHMSGWRWCQHEGFPVIPHVVMWLGYTKWGFLSVTFSCRNTRRSSCKMLIILSNLNQNCNVSTNFCTTPPIPNFKKIPSMVLELLQTWQC
jgi:hypothetical protein